MCLCPLWPLSGSDMRLGPCTRIPVAPGVLTSVWSVAAGVCGGALSHASVGFVGGVRPSSPTQAFWPLEIPRRTAF
eukprot:9768409-Alexandrium_andersonii.AAC.1